MRVRGIYHWFSQMRGDFWTFFAASFCFDLGMYIFFVLYNLYLLDRGFKDDFLGLVASASAIGSIAGTVPAGMLAKRCGLRAGILVSLALAAITFALRAVVRGRISLLALAFLAGAAVALWAICLSPAVAHFTDERSRARGFSLIFSSGIGVGILGGQFGGRLPGWFATLGSLGPLEAKRCALLTACGLVALAAWPASRVKFASGVPTEKRIWPPNPFLARFLPAIALWSLAIGAFDPFFNAFFFQHFHFAVRQVGTVYSYAHASELVAALAAPVLFGKIGIINSVALAELGTAAGLAGLAAAPGAATGVSVYLGYSAAQWMSEPGISSLLMSRVSSAERTSASAWNFLVASISQAIATAIAGFSFARFGYNRILWVLSGVALVAAIAFRMLLGKESRTSAAEQPVATPERPRPCQAREPGTDSTGALGA